MTKRKPTPTPTPMPSVEHVQHELGSAKSLDDFFGREGIFARLFADTRKLIWLIIWRSIEHQQRKH